MTGTPVGGEQVHLLRRGLHLEYVTLGWNVVGVVVLAVAAVGARSVALAGFGLDSLVEILASAVVVGELRATATPEREQRALRLIGLAFFGLSAYIAAQGLLVLVLRARPAISGLGIAWTGVTCAVMFVLAGAKTATGSRLDHPVLLTEGKVTRIDGLLAGAVVGGLVLRAVAGWWWADPLVGFVIVGYGIKEGGAAWSHSHL